MTEYLRPRPPQALGDPPSKRLFIKTYGCQMNVYDSERMADVLRPLGYGMADAAEDADLVVLNTCHIREKASEKVYSEVGRMKELRELKAESGLGRMGIVVAGCVAQAEGAEIMTRAPAVDLVVGPQAYHQLPELIARTARARGERLAADFCAGRQVRRPARQRRRPSGPTAVPDRAGGLRQVLHLLRGALHPRRGVRPSGGGRAGGGAQPGRTGRARGHPARPERQRLCGRRAGRRRPGRWRGWRGRWRPSRACRASATPPATRATWPTT